ncbi:hypothetical protein D3C78_1574520 [compost metagenome]
MDVGSLGAHAAVGDGAFQRADQGFEGFSGLVEFFDGVIVLFDGVAGFTYFVQHFVDHYGGLLGDRVQLSAFHRKFVGLERNAQCILQNTVTHWEFLHVFANKGKRYG